MNELSSNDAYRKKSKIKKTVYEVILIVSIILMLFPLLGILYLSVKPNNEILAGNMALPQALEWSNYAKAFETIDFITMFKNTLFISVVTLIGEMILGIAAAYALGRFKFERQRLQNFFYTYFIIGIIVPTFIYLYPLYKMNFAMGLIDTPWSVILPYIGWSAPMNIMMLYAAFSMVPDSLEEAAVIDGCGRFRLLMHVNIPVIRSTIVTLLVLNFLGVWNEFGVSVIMLTDESVQVISLASTKFVGQFVTDYGAMAATVVMLCLPQIAIFSLFQKYVTADAASGAVKG